MLDQILRSVIRQRWLVLVLVGMVAGLGYWNYERLPIDAVPDITNVQVQVYSSAPGYTPLEVEQRVSFPLENAMAGLPRLDYTRSISRYGLSQITVVFEDGTDIYFARQLVTERLTAARASLPAAVEPTLGPIATGLGEIFMFTVDAAPGATNPDGTLDHADRSSDCARLGHSTAAATCARRRRGQSRRRLQEGISRSARSREAACFRACLTTTSWSAAPQ